MLSLCAMNCEVFTDYIASGAATPRLETEGAETIFDSPGFRKFRENNKY